MKIYYYSMATGYKWKEYINPQSGKKKNRLLILIQHTWISTFVVYLSEKIYFLHFLVSYSGMGSITYENN